MANAPASANFSLGQGAQFADMTKTLHGGRRTRRAQRGGMVPLESAFEALPGALRADAGIGAQDSAFAELPGFVGKYGGAGGARRMRGGMAPMEQNDMLLSKDMYGQAFLHPDWAEAEAPKVGGKRKTRKARKVSRKARKTSRKASRKARKTSRKASRKARKASRKARKASRKARKASRKARKASRKARKASRKARK